MFKTLLLPLLAITLVTGCSGHGQRSLYYWGNYEAVLLDSYINPGEAPDEVQIEKLTATIETAKKREHQVPPGLYAHLGMLYLRQGHTGSGVAALKEEKALYPESAVFIDGLLARANLEAQP